MTNQLGRFYCSCLPSTLEIEVRSTSLKDKNNSVKKKLIILALIIGFLLFLKFGRSSYVPILKKLSGKETVESAIHKIEKEAKFRLERNLNKAGFNNQYPEEIILVAFKEEEVLEVYAKDHEGVKLIKKYPFTANSGKLGPKLKEGDRQIPEGIYHIAYLNPNSSYHLSLKVNYPNEFDKSKTKFSKIKDMGGDIFIHGKALTIGCIPIGDLAIEELFLLVHKAFNKQVKVIISPRDFRKNSKFPSIESVNWENELYVSIESELKNLTQ